MNETKVIFEPGDVCVVAPREQLVDYLESGERYYICEAMRKLSGTIVTIAKKHPWVMGAYSIQEDKEEYYWAPRWLIPLNGFEPQTSDSVSALYT